MLVHLNRFKHPFLFPFHFFKLLCKYAPLKFWYIFLCIWIENFSLCILLLIPTWPVYLYLSRKKYVLFVTLPKTFLAFNYHIVSVAFNYYCQFAPKPTSTNIVLKNLSVLSPSCLCVQDAKKVTFVMVNL